MTAPADVLVIGAGGLLGSALMRHRPLSTVPVGPLDWRADDAPRRLADAITSTIGNQPIRSVAWCAGAGVIGTGNDELAAETDLFASVLEVLAGQADTTVFLASSAGGVYAGSVAIPITESTPVAPLSAYAANKIRQETLLADWCSSTGSRAVVGRISTLYGPGQASGKPQGLITALCRSAVTRTPVQVFVPFDNLRDFLFVDDAARIVSDSIVRAGTLEPGSVATKIIASQRSTSIGRIIAEVGRVCSSRPLIAVGASATRALHGDVITVRSEQWADIDRHPLTTLPAGIDAVYRSVVADTTGARPQSGRAG